MKKQWRPHRFTPLAELMNTEAWRSGTPSHLIPKMQSSLADGYQQAMERGYREGYASGEEEGRNFGLLEGREAGRREGIELGRSETLVGFEKISAPVDAMLASLSQLQADYQVAMRREVIDLLAKVARQVIRAELALQPAQMLALVDETLATMPHQADSGIDVYLNEGDLKRIREINHARAVNWNLIADPHLESGECRVKSGTHEADAGCKQRLAACVDQIKEQLLPHADESIEAAA